MTRPARVHLTAKTDMSRPGPCTVTVERGEVPLISVRPFRRRRTYTLPLAAVAEMVVLRVVTAELEIKRQERAARRRGRRSAP